MVASKYVTSLLTQTSVVVLASMPPCFLAATKLQKSLPRLFPNCSLIRRWEMRLVVEPRGGGGGGGGERGEPGEGQSIFYTAYIELVSLDNLRRRVICVVVCLVVLIPLKTLQTWEYINRIRF